jgi:hypothetical protein
LCEEPLVRPTVVSHGGRVVLVGPPLTQAQVASRVRMLVANADGKHKLHAASQLAGVEVRDRLSARHWVGCLKQGAGSMSAVFGDDVDGSLTALLPLAGDPGSNELLESVREEITAPGAVAPKEEILTKLLGDRYAAIHLPPSGEQWTIYPSSQRARLRLCSPQRLPKLWDHSRSSPSPKLFTKRAASGDIIMLSSAPELPPSVNPSLDVCVGGPGLLSRLIEGSSSASTAQSTLIVEVL